MKRITLSLLLLCYILMACVSCSEKKQSAEKGAAPEPETYSVLTLPVKSATLYLTFPAVLEGKQDVEIRPKVDGFVEAIYIDEGSAVKKGQKLFKLSAPQYQEEVNNAQAQIITAESELNSAELQLNKTRPLVDKGIISHYELDFATNSLKGKKAAVAQAKSRLSNARTNVGYTNIVSPINGIVSAIPFKVGSLVSSSTAQPLTTISNNGDIYAYVSLNEKQLLSFSTTYPGKTINEKIRNLPPVLLTLSDGKAYPNPGKVETVNGLINTETGSASFRAIFPNTSGIIRSGGSASLRVPQHMENIILVPQKSTFELQGKHFLYTIDKNSVVKSTEIEIAQTTTGQFFVVKSGLKAGDRIVIEGSETLKDGVKIKPEEQSAEVVYQGIK